ncbi:MAG: methyltransferase domain-containing protein [Alphaproteobacteria bacterium]|nr:methyltransferase domain-containing protein [Alphaproteobacteria bacterium]
MVRLNNLTERLSYCADCAGGKRALSKETGISEAQLFRYLKGESEPTVSKLLTIANVAEVNAGWLLTGEGKIENPPDVLLPHNSKLLREISQTFEESLIEVKYNLPLQLRPAFLDLIYTDMLMEIERSEYPIELNHLTMLFKIYFLSEIKREELTHYGRFIAKDFHKHGMHDLVTLESITNQICRANMAIYSTPASQFYYDKMGRSVWPLAAKRLDSTIEYARSILKKNKLKILDLVCGNVREISYIHRHHENIDVIGVDGATYPIELCRQYVDSGWLPENSFIQADLRFLPFEENMFDIIYSRQTLEFFPYFKKLDTGLLQVMQQVYKTLKSGGLFLAISRYGHGREYVNFQQLLNENIIQEIAQKVGFEVLSLKPWNYSKQSNDAYPATKYDEWLRISLRKPVA